MGKTRLARQSGLIRKGKIVGYSICSKKRNDLKNPALTYVGDDAVNKL